MTVHDLAHEAARGYVDTMPIAECVCAVLDVLGACRAGKGARSLQGQMAR
jgi:hypothetical protein